jgi:hypothetical protein
MSNEIKGTGNSYTAEFWEYDPKLGRRWNLDPKPTIGISQYSTFSNNPIFFNDILGDSAAPPIFPRHPIRLLTNPSDVVYVPYNIIGIAVNGFQSAFNKAGDSVNALTSGSPVESVNQQASSDYNAIKSTVSAPINYVVNNSAKKQWADTKADFSNPDTYFKSLEQAVVIGATWKLGVSSGSAAASNLQSGVASSGLFMSSSEITASLFSLRNGYGLFGKNGLRIGSYKIEAMYANEAFGSGTIFSMKQVVQGGNLLRWDYGILHGTQRLGLHSTFRFNMFGKTFGSASKATGQKPWFAPFTFWKYQR